MKRLLFALALIPLGPPAAAVSLNAHGAVAHGVGGTVTSIDNRQVVDGAGANAARWFDETHVIYQRNADLALALYDVGSGASTIVAGDGANTLQAHGGVWAAWRAGTGLFSSTGLQLPDAGLLDIGPDGAIAYTPNYQAGRGAIVRFVDGREQTLDAGDFVVNLQLLGNARAIWTNGIGVSTAGIPPVSLVAHPVWRPRAVELNGEWWVAYWTDTRGLVLHPFASPFGYVIRSTPDAFAHDLVAVNGRLRVAFATNEAEGPGSVIIRDVDPGEPRIDLRVTSTTAPTLPSPRPVPPAPAPSPAPLPDPPPVQEIPRCDAFPSAVAPFLSELRALAVRGEAQGWPADLQAQHAALRGKLTRIGAAACWQLDHNWGLLKKDGGSHATRADGTNHATDILVYCLQSCHQSTIPMRLVDVFSDTDPQWGVLDVSDTRTPDFWIQPLPEGSRPAPIPSPAADPRLADLQQQLTAAHAKIAELQQQLGDALRDSVVLAADRDDLRSQLDRARAELAALKTRQAPSCEAKIPPALKAFGIKVGCRVIQP